MSKGVHRHEVEYSDLDLLELRRRVFIAYTDLAAAGSRALLGINMRVEYFKIDVPELGSTLRPACLRTEEPGVVEQHFAPIQVLNCKYEQFSLVVVNAILPGNKTHHVTNKILDLIKQSRRVETVTILSVLRFDINPKLHPLKAVYELCFNTKQETHLPSVPGDVLVMDPFFSILLQMLLVERIPTSCLLAPGHRVSGGLPSQKNGVLQTIKVLQDVIADLTHLRFSHDVSSSLYFYGHVPEARTQYA